MANYTKEFWIEYNKKRSGANKQTVQFIKDMFNNPTLKNRRMVTWDNYYMLTGYLTQDGDDFRRLQSRINKIDG